MYMYIHFDCCETTGDATLANQQLILTALANINTSNGNPTMSCGSQSIFQIGGAGCFPISIKDANGQPVDADALPTITHMTLNGVGVDETTPAYAIALSQVQDDTPAAVTGEYQLKFDPSAFSAGDTINLGVQAVVNGTTLSVIKDALIKDEQSERPSIC